MVKELVMDNMYKTGLLSENTGRADKLAYTSNDFQNIFADKSGIQFSTERKTDIAEVRFQNDKVSTNSTTRTPITTPYKTSADRAGMSETAVNNPENDGYSFTVRESLNAEDSVSENTGSEEISEETSVNTDTVKESEIKEDDVTVEEETIDSALNDSGKDGTSNTASKEEDDPRYGKDKIVLIQPEPGITINQTPLEGIVSDITPAQEETELMPADVDTVSDVETVDIKNNLPEPEQVISDSVIEIDNSESVAKLPDAVLQETPDTENAVTDIKNNVKTEVVKPNSNVIQPAAYEIASVQTQLQDVDTDVDVPLTETEIKDDSKTNMDIAPDTSIKTDEQTDTTVKTTDESVNLSTDEGWQILDESEQYEYTGTIADNLNEDDTSSMSKTTVVDTEIQEDNTEEPVISKDFQMTDTAETDIVKTDDKTVFKDTDLKTSDDAGLKILENISDNETPADIKLTQELKNDDIKTGNEETEKNVSELINDTDETILSKEVAETDSDEETVNVNTSSLDTNVDIETNKEEKKSDSVKVQTDDEETVDVKLETDTDTEFNDNNYNTESDAELYQSADNLQEDNIDLTLQERTRLAYVDMIDNNTDTNTEDVIAQLEVKFDSKANVEQGLSAKQEEPVIETGDTVNYSDIDADVDIQVDTKLRATSLEDVVDEKVADDLNITLKGNSSTSGDVYAGTNSTTEQLIRFSIEGETGFEGKFAGVVRQGAQSQTASAANLSSKEILAQINEKLTSFNFRPGAKLTMQLSPENLGTVEIKLTNTLDGIRAEMTATSDDAGNALNKHIDDLRDTLQKYGVRLDRVTVSTNPSQQSAAQQDYTEQQGNSQKQQHEQKHQQKESAAQKFEDMVSSFFEENKE